MRSDTNLVRRNYSRFVDSEWKRLVADPFHRLEYETTRRFLKQYLPRKGRILDAGGGPGRYTVDLAKAGYRVVLLDPVPAHLEYARKMIDVSGVGGQVDEVVEGTITDLSRYETGSFDGVICLGGPLSHVQAAKSRRRAIQELVRVTRSRSPIFISVMSRFGVLLATPSGWPQVAGRPRYFRNVVFQGNDTLWRGEGYCHFFTARELKEAVFDASARVDVVQMVGLEGLIPDEQVGNAFAKRHPKAWKTWRSVHDSICTDPFVVDASAHMLMIARKK